MPVKKIYEAEPTQIQVAGDRQRQQFNPKAMLILVNSIKNVGQIQPGVCTKIGKKIELIVGERRLRACEEIGIPYKFILKEDVTDPYVLERIQFEENLIRDDLTWLEEVFALERLQTLLTKTEGFKTLRETADYLGIGKSILHQDVQLAIWARQVPEVAAAPNKTTAKKIVKMLTLTVKRDDALEESIKKIEEKSKKSLKDQYIEKHGLDATKPLTKKDEKAIEEIVEPTEDTTSLQEKKLMEYDSQCQLGTMEEKLKDFPNKHFDVVFFDPPWGVEYDKNQKGAEYQKKYEDSKQEFLLKFPIQLKLLFDKMAEDSHIYIFFGIINHEFIYKTILNIGFKTSRMPLMWHKKGACRTRNHEYEYGRCYEPIAYARKGLKKLQGSPIPDIIETPQVTQKIKDIHPSAKHPEIYRKLLMKSAYPGDKVLDPTAGSGMMGVAAEDLRPTHNLDWTQIEMDEDYRNLEIFNLLKGYGEFSSGISAGSETPSKPKALASEVTDFRELEIGSKQWQYFWKDNPDKQNDMIAWRKETMGLDNL